MDSPAGETMPFNRTPNVFSVKVILPQTLCFRLLLHWIPGCGNPSAQPAVRNLGCLIVSLVPHKPTPREKSRKDGCGSVGIWCLTFVEYVTPSIIDRDILSILYVGKLRPREDNLPKVTQINGGASTRTSML